MIQYLAVDARREYGTLRSAALELLAAPQRFGDVKRELGIASDAQTHTLLARLRRQGLVERVERGLYRKVADGSA